MTQILDFASISRNPIIRRKDEGLEQVSEIVEKLETLFLDMNTF